MSQSLETFFSAWSESDADQRADKISASVAANAVYSDPRCPEPISGREALTEYTGAFSANAPGWTASVVKSDETAGLIRATIAFGGTGPDGSEMQQLGQYFVECDADGLLAKITGFVGTGAPE
ncbi:nuclear transport factor 2 family protein [Pacificoceanicola onchidii]|uniref:nuclear transport factor 2 family protein n=1 Tax=Pacificoceanicola onchidii TaxID=2562685 RepID=UPI0010A697EE|nr:nuclear transport factor 2 family protein [Pacificoceanicola onchidii]